MSNATRRKVEKLYFQPWFFSATFVWDPHHSSILCCTVPVSSWKHNPSWHSISMSLFLYIPFIQNSMQHTRRKCHTLNFEQCTFSPVCNTISHVFIEEYLARQESEAFVQWNVIPINCTILRTAHQTIFAQPGVAWKSQGQCVSLGLLCKIKPVSEKSNPASPSS